MNKRPTLRNKARIDDVTLHRFILSLLVIIGVLFLIYAERLQGQAAATLIGVIVWSLFGRGRK